MNEVNAKPANHPSASYIPHDCHAWNIQHYHSSPDYSMATCGMCKRVTGFRWRSWWMRIRGLFTAEPILTKVIDPDP